MQQAFFVWCVSRLCSMKLMTKPRESLTVVKRENGRGGGEGIQAERIFQNSSVSVVYLSLPLSLFSPLTS